MCVCVCVCVCVCARALNRSVSNSLQLFVTPWTAVCQAPLSMEFSGENAGAGCHFLLQEIFHT